MKALILILLCFSCQFLLSADLVSVRPLSNTIIEVHIDDGYLIQHQIGESLNNDQIVADPLDEEIASLVASYALSSPDDADFVSSQAPLEVFRKSKGTEFANICEGWEFQDFFGVVGCENSSADHAKEHWIYLVLAAPLKTGFQYEIDLGGLGLSGSAQQTFIFDESVSNSSAIHVNNLGYSTEATLKFAYVYKWLGDGGSLDLSSHDNAAFDLIEVSINQSVYSGNLSFRKDEFSIETFQNNPNETPNQNFLGAEVYECDFSEFSEPGRYRISIEGIGSSNPFLIACDALEPAFNFSMKGLFQNRSGIALNPPYIESPRPAPHNPQETPGFANRLKFTSTTWCEVSAADADIADKELYEAGYLGDLESFGWYMDAGDWDGYLRHMEVPAKLLFTYEHFPQNFTDGQLNIIENENGIPDILDEARWLLRFYKRLKDETEDKGWTSGGVPGSRIFADLWGEDMAEGDIAQYSYEDNARDWYVSGEDPAITFYYAAIAAHYHYLLEREGLDDPEDINWLAEAVNAFEWAQNQYNPSLSCHDASLPALMSYAAAAIYRITGQESHASFFEAAIEDLDINSLDPLDGVNAFGSYVYALTEGLETDAALLSLIESKIEEAADAQLVTNVDLRACRWGGNHYFPMLAGHGTTPYVFEGIMGYVLLKENNLSKAASYWGVLHSTADYFLGTNPLKMSWITGLNQYSPSMVFHLDGRQNGNLDGYIPYGPWQREELFNIGSWHHQWAEKTAYPENPNIWPGHERWFSQNTSPLAGEFTINQNNANAAALYGALSGAPSCSATTGLALEPISDDDTIQLYPNPATDKVILSSISQGLGNISCFGIDGKLIFQVQTAHQKQTIKVDFLKPGIYLLKVGEQQLKFVKK